jgi:hypothetical protein
VICGPKEPVNTLCPGSDEAAATLAQSNMIAGEVPSIWPYSNGQTEGRISHLNVMK